jgi:hypothetical protein
MYANCKRMQALATVFSGYLFKKWEEREKNAPFANGALIGYHLCESEPVIPRTTLAFYLINEGDQAAWHAK